jgi:LysM repeat protein
MSKKWMRLFLIVAVLAVNLGLSVGEAGAQTTYATYVVQRGDTLGKIAAKYCTTWTVIYDLNRNVIYNPNVIYPGTVLTVPLNCTGSDGGSGTGTGTVVDYGARLHAMGTYSAPYYTVVWGDTLYSIGKRFGMAWQSIARANGLAYPYIYAGQRLLIPGGSTGTTPPPTSQPGTPTRITFQAGATSASTVGTISQNIPVSYILWGSAGQTLTVQTVSRGDALVISIGTTGVDLLPLTGTNSQVANTVATTLPATGDYIVTVRPTVTPESPTLKFDITFTIQ